MALKSSPSLVISRLSHCMFYPGHLFLCMCTLASDASVCVFVYMLLSKRKKMWAHKRACFVMFLQPLSQMTSTKAHIFFPKLNLSRGCSKHSHLGPLILRSHSIHVPIHILNMKKVWNILFSVLMCSRLYSFI